MNASSARMEVVLGSVEMESMVDSLFFCVGLCGSALLFSKFRIVLVLKFFFFQTYDKTHLVVLFQKFLVVSALYNTRIVVHRLHPRLGNSFACVTFVAVVISQSLFFIGA